MFQIDVPSAAPALPAPLLAGTPGFFTGGDPATATAPTTLSADFANMLQMELINVVTAAGIAPSKTVYTQVRDAIRLLAIAAVRAASYAVDTGSVNAIVATPSAAPTALVPGLSCTVKVANTNTTDTSLNLAGLGAVPVRYNGVVLAAGSILAGEIYAFEFDGGLWELVSPDVTAAIPAASTSQAGIVALATAAETAGGTNASKATTPADVASAVQSGAYTYAADTGSANTLQAELTPALVALAAGVRVSVKAAAANTGATTLNVNGLGAVAVIYGGNPLIAGDIVAGQVYHFAYDGTAWELSNPSAAVSLGAVGYSRTPDGQVVQWGTGPGYTGEGLGTPINFPFSFPNACRTISYEVLNPSNSNNRDSAIQTETKSASVFTPYYQNNGGAGANCDGFTWRAYGD